jgi:formate-dependent nitrite reductase cytochrome c552 subunit
VQSEIYAPTEVKTIFKKACYDCHSNETNWVWYTKVAPISFLLAKHVKDGRKHLNFSEWGLYDAKKVQKKMEEIWEEIKEEEMPPWLYRVGHSEAKLTPEEKNIIRNWATNK